VSRPTTRSTRRWRYAGKSVWKQKNLQSLVVLCAVIVSLAVTETRADYVMPPFTTVVTEATAIVDATVVEPQDRGRVRIQVHEVLRGGDAPAVLTGAWLTCPGVDLSRKLKVGQRYVLLLHGTGLYEEGTYYEVREGKDGLECNCWDGSENLARRWMPISDFKRLLNEARPRP
jgi:hypothetical protein